MKARDARDEWDVPKVWALVWGFGALVSGFGFGLGALVWGFGLGVGALVLGLGLWFVI